MARERSLAPSLGSLWGRSRLVSPGSWTDTRLSTQADPSERSRRSPRGKSEFDAASDCHSWTPSTTATTRITVPLHAHSLASNTLTGFCRKGSDRLLPFERSTTLTSSPWQYAYTNIPFFLYVFESGEGLRETYEEARRGAQVIEEERRVCARGERDIGLLHPPRHDARCGAAGQPDSNRNH